MPVKLGIEEVKSVVKMMLSLGELIDALADGVGISDLGALLGLVKSVPSGVAALRSGKVLPELKDLDEAEKADMKAYVAANFTIKEKDIEMKVEAALSTAIDLLDLLKLV